MKNILLNNVFNEEKYVTIKKDKRPTGTLISSIYFFNIFRSITSHHKNKPTKNLTDIHPSNPVANRHQLIIFMSKNITKTSYISRPARRIQVKR